ncbi:MAG TPA: PhzF family phenazine biosynthesis protein [Gemmatimonadales bacterium]|jgi:PhzF family phenazine biosynthesis protein|nr:PhzF family phenazine biosynthesis protein [Gemmatimonadales bacterium]
MPRRFCLVDVFHGEPPFSGNPLAVVLDAEGLTTEEMQRITRWMNLSETAFLLPPTAAGADYRVRIFTLERELPFAGHPTLGSCHAWLQSGGIPQRETQVVQECGAGLIPVRCTEQTLAFAAPPLIRSGPVDETTVQAMAGFLGIRRPEVVDAQWADNGPGWVVLLLRSAEAVLALDPPKTHPSRIELGVIGPYPPGDAAAFELRAFFSDHQGRVLEDPVTGSLNASAAQWLLSSGRATAPYTCAQGTRLGRSGRVFISQDGAGTVWVGGRTRTLFAGACGF